MNCMFCSSRIRLQGSVAGLTGLLCLLLWSSASAVEPDKGATITYEGGVRPVLKTHCFRCHGEAGTVEGGLDLRLRRLIMKGGESGPIIDIENPSDSVLLERVTTGEMPPEEVKHRPTPDEIDILRQWVMNEAPGVTEPDGLDPSEYITTAEKSFWSYQPLLQPEIPITNHPALVRAPIDAFLLHSLEGRGLSFGEEAGRHTLIRRLSFDLWGLPPTPQQVERFVGDSSPLAYERLVDQLLSSPRYGERWGRHWLDVAGYADSEGYTDEDTQRPDAWRYRDYVIQAFNGGKPINQFFVEQLAGDELVSRPYGDLPPQELDALIATGFLRMAPDGTATAANKSVAINDSIAKSLEIISSSMLGMTVACAECHDHRYDPISQKDYYRFRAIFEPAYHWKSWQTPNKRRQSLYTDDDRTRAAEIEEQAKEIEVGRTEKQQEFIQATFEKQLAKLPEEMREVVRLAHDTPDKERTSEQKELLKKNPSVNVTASSLYLYDRKAADELKALADKANEVRKTKPPERFVRVLAESVADNVPVSHLFIRGDHEQPGEQVSAAGFRILGGTLFPDDLELPSTGRRLQFARWLTSDRHPLSARVFVNRVWLHHFGRGLVNTPGDFGQLGEPASHPELLDYLASEFRSSGWNLKRLHRVLVLSTAYRQSSRPSEDGLRADPENHLLWRMPVRRVEAEVLRDSILQISGELLLDAFGPSVPVMADRDGKFVVGIENLNAGRPGAVIPLKGQDFRRSVYVQVRRSRRLTVLDTFDAPRMTPSCIQRSYSASATQSLMLMNGEFPIARAEQLATRVMTEASNELPPQIDFAWQLCYSRQPDPDELSSAINYVQQTEKSYRERHAKSDDRTRRQFAMASLCHALLSSNEFLYIE
ncbi:MAG: PSD1 and planctomycete cytochrome C domain-containing protein [Pirellulaceae bacterium]